MRAVRAFRQSYGASPLHLVGVLLTFVVAYEAASRVHALDPHFWWRYAIWFVGAALFHDLVLFPLYAGLDRLVALLGRHRMAPGTVNHVRVPALLSGLLLLVFGPAIFRGGQLSFGIASGKNQDVFLARWLIITAVLFGVSALLYGVRRLRAARTD